jgi:hypothetical protein
MDGNIIQQRAIVYEAQQNTTMLVMKDFENIRCEGLTLEKQIFNRIVNFQERKEYFIYQSDTYDRWWI